MSAHAAAVEAMAEASCVNPDERNSCDGLPWRHPECALAALVRSEAVRAALVEAAKRGHTGYTDGYGPAGYVHLILAALTPPGDDDA